MALTKDCDCQTQNIGGVNHHEAHCASWEGINCGECGSEIKPGQDGYNVRYRGEPIIVCEPCHKNFYAN